MNSTRKEIAIINVVLAAVPLFATDERLSLDSKEREAVPLRKREIWFINMMNGEPG